MDVPGWLSVGAEYCTQSRECKTVGEGPDGLDPIPLQGGGTAPPSIGCRENPEYAACIAARVPVRNGRNYAIGGLDVGPIGIGVFIAPSVPYSSADLSRTPEIFFPVRIGKTPNGILTPGGRGTTGRMRARLQH